MDKLYSKKQTFLTDVLYISVIFTLTSLIGRVIGLNISLHYQILIIVFISLIIKNFIVYPLIFLISSILILLFLVFINLYKFPIFLYLKSTFVMLISNIIQNIQSLEPILDNNIFLLYILILIFTSIFTAIIVYRLEKVFILLPIYLLMFLIYWYSFIDDAFIFTATFLCFFLILFGIDKYKKNKRTDDKTFNIWTSTSIVYGVLIISIAFFLPKSDNYIAWPSLQQKIYNMFPVVEDLRYYKEFNRNTSNSKLFNFSTSGFSEKDKDLGGPLVLSERKVMTVESYEPLYLRGNTKHLYTGRRWTSFPYDVKEYNLKQNFNFILNSEKDRYYTSENINIKFDTFSSKTIFAPYKPISITSDRNFSIFVNDDDIITSKDGTYENEGYSVEFLKPLPFNTLLLNRVHKRKNDLMYLNFYLELPENIITNRTKQLTSSLVKDMYDDYEKAITIQNYLRNNYKYNLNVKNLPEGADFVDNFLFEEKEGYCTYFASAMAVMLRLEGIPTRYVEGYVVDEKIGGNKYQVRQKHAHTWVEAFIEPVGWMNFEPTAAYETLDGEEENEEIVPDIKEEIQEEEIETTEPTEDKDTIVDGGDATIDIEGKSNIKLYKTILLSSITLIFFFIIIRILIRFLKYKKKEKLINSISKKEKTIYIYKDIVDYLDILELPLNKGETHFDYANRVENEFIDSKDSGIKYITNIFVKIKYSDEEPSDREVLDIVEYRDFLNANIKDEFGKWKFFYRRYINIYFKNKKELP